MKKNLANIIFTALAIAALSVFIAATALADDAVSDRSVSANETTPSMNYVTALDGVPVIVAKQKVDISDAFSYSGTIKKYTVEPKGYGKVTKKGILTGKKDGKITISAYNENKEKIGEIERYVIVQKLGTMTSSRRGEVINAEQYLRSESGYYVKPTKWSITSSLATIDTVSGQITISPSGKHGNATVTVYYGEGRNAAKYKARLKVNLPYLNLTKVTMEAGTTKKLKLKNAPDGKPIVWDSSKKKVATVNDSGKIKAKKEGKCEITATVDNYSYTCKVTVKDKD